MPLIRKTLVMQVKPGQAGESCSPCALLSLSSSSTLHSSHTPLSHPAPLFPPIPEAYEASHNAGFWPEMGEALKAHGARNSSISLHPETLQLFALVEVEDEEKWAAIASTEICKKWWAWMQEFIVFNADGTPATTDLKQVFK